MPSWTSALRPTLFSAFGGAFVARSAFFTARTQSTAAANQAQCTRWLIRNASPMASRECPTPLILLRTPGLTWSGADRDTEDAWSRWADMFAQRGYTTVEVDISVHQPASLSLPDEPGPDESNPVGTPAFPPAIAAAKRELNAQIRMLAIPFAPVIIASGPGCLVAQAYVSDHPAGALVMVAPPPDADPRAKGAQEGWEWPQFNYEPRFPILIVAEEKSLQSVQATRVGQAEAAGVRRGGQGVTIEEAKDGVRGEKTRMEVERWMDSCGF